jgi:hypothetical protein
MYGGVLAIGIGVFGHTLVPTVIVSCERSAAGPVGCTIEERLLFDLVSARHDRVSTVTAVFNRPASSTRRNREPRLVLGLITGDGERVLGTTTLANAERVFGSINGHLTSRTPSFAVSFGPGGLDWLYRQLTLLMAIAGIGLLVAALHVLVRGSTRMPEPPSSAG